MTAWYVSFLFLGCFAIFAVVAKAGRATVPHELSATVSAFTSWEDVKAHPPFVEQPIRTRSLKWPMMSLKVSVRVFIFSKAWIQQEEVQKSSFLSDHLNYNMLKVIMGFLPIGTKYKLPAPTLSTVLLQNFKTSLENFHVMILYIVLVQHFWGKYCIFAPLHSFDSYSCVLLLLTWKRHDHS